MSEPAIKLATSAPDSGRYNCPDRQLDVLTLRAWARAYLWSIGEIELQEAIDGLQAFAVGSGLVDTIGQDAVQKIFSETFAPFRGGR